jgi:hypothetical protein
LAQSHTLRSYGGWDEKNLGVEFGSDLRHRRRVRLTLLDCPAQLVQPGNLGELEFGLDVVASERLIEMEDSR